MKSVTCIIWILAALLLVATLDNLPDPPAANPRAAVCKVLHLRDHARDAALPRSAALVTPDSLPASFVAVDPCESCHPSDCIVIAGQAADSSPPAPRLGRKPASQS